MNVYLDFLGCRLNEAELQQWRAEFLQQGIQVTRDLEKSDLIVFNTCAVTGEAARKSRQNIRKLHKKSPQAKLVVTGCYASLETATVAGILGVDLVIGNKDKEQLVKRVVEELSLPTTTIQASEPGESPLFSKNRDRAFIKVQDGCRYRCTYCIVTIARGDEKSRALEELVAEINQLYKSGIFEIVLTGVHVGGYGSDIDSSLYELVDTILKQTSIPRIRFASVEPWDLPENFFELFENPRLMPHMHLPLQSGCNAILKKMSRRCRTEAFQQLVNKARAKIANFNITTDIIVGFPGENNDEWLETLTYVQQIPFGHIHIFSFSAREGTKAARLPGAIDSMTKKARSKQLHQLAAQLKYQQLQNMLNTHTEVLLESDFETLNDGRFGYWGHTENYHKVNLVSENANLAGCIINTLIVGVNPAKRYLEVQMTQIIKKARQPASLPVQQISVASFTN